VIVIDEIEGKLNFAREENTVTDYMPVPQDQDALVE